MAIYMLHDKLLKKARSLHLSGKYVDAELLYRQILEKEPDHPDANNLMGVLANSVGKNDFAKLYLKKAIELMPNHSGCYVNMGNVYQSEKEYTKSMIWYKMAIELNAKNRTAYNNLGVAYLHTGQLEDALTVIEKAIAIAPDYADAHLNYGEVLKNMGNYNAAVNAFNKAIFLCENNVEAHWNRSLALLTMGDFLNGWPGYEWRWQRPKTVKRNFLSGKRWQGEDLRGKTLFVFEEQGFGDTLQFIRYLPMLGQAGANVILEVRPALVRLVCSNPVYSRLCVRLQGADPQFTDHFDFHVPLMSLPGLFKTQIETIPANGPYLKADPELVRIWKHRISRHQTFKVGLVWAGSPDHVNDNNRSIPLQLFTKLGQIEGVSYYSIQKEKHGKWTDAQSMNLFETDFGPRISDFADTAAIIENMDLLICVDTSVVHLGGAMGKPVWVLVPFAPDFRWMLDRKDSPWYPGMRLFRQSAVDDWPTVIDEVHNTLVEKINQNKESQ